MRGIVLFLLLFSTTVHSLSLEDKIQIEDMLRTQQLEMEILRDDFNGNRGVTQYSPPKPKMKVFGKSDNGTEYSIFLDSIKTHSSGRGKYFIEFTQSNFPRYEDKLTFFYSQTGYQIDCETKEIRKRWMVYFDVNENPILLNSKGKSYSEMYSKRFELPFTKISTQKNILENMYLRYICR